MRKAFRRAVEHDDFKSLAKAVRERKDMEIRLQDQVENIKRQRLSRAEEDRQMDNVRREWERYAWHCYKSGIKDILKQWIMEANVRRDRISNVRRLAVREGEVTVWSIWEVLDNLSHTNDIFNDMRQRWLRPSLSKTTAFKMHYELMIKSDLIEYQ